jgi:hypothetical protein
MVSRTATASASRWRDSPPSSLVGREAEECGQTYGAHDGRLPVELKRQQVSRCTSMDLDIGDEESCARRRWMRVLGWDRGKDVPDHLRWGRLSTTTAGHYKHPKDQPGNINDGIALAPRSLAGSLSCAVNEVIDDSAGAPAEGAAPLTNRGTEAVKKTEDEDVPAEVCEFLVDSLQRHGGQRCGG